MKLCIKFFLTLIFVWSFSLISLGNTYPSDWAEDEVFLAMDKGFMVDTRINEFQDEITREDFCELVVSLYEKLTNTKATKGNKVFIDTQNDEILKAYNLGIISGISETEFAPNDNITRQELCTMLVRCIDVAIEKANIKYFTYNGFTDYNKISSWALDYVNYAYYKDIIKGVGDGKLDPLGTTTYEQAVIFCYRILTQKSNFYEKENYVYEANTDNFKIDEKTQIEFVDNIIIIFFKDDVTELRKNEIIKSINGDVVGKFETVNQYQVQISNNTLDELKKMSDELMKLEEVSYATYDMVVEIDTNSMTPNDPWGENIFKKNDWNTENPSGNNWWAEAVDAPGAWGYNDKMIKSKIGVVDGGFDTEHEDLEDILSFATENNAILNSKSDHGTHVAGIIGAKANNDKGITGLLWNTDIICYDIYPNWTGDNPTRSFIEFGFITSIINGAKVVNFSLGASQSLEDSKNTYSEDYINYWANRYSCIMSILLNQGYDFIVVQSAGNGAASDGIGVDSINGLNFASITKENSYKTDAVTADDILNRIIVVSAAEQNGSEYMHTIFSNGGTQVDIAAPGQDVYSTITNNRYTSLPGTSMSAPIVAGVAGMVWAINPELTGSEVKAIVCDPNNTKYIVKDNPNSPNAVGDFPMVNAKLAVEAALKTVPYSEYDEVSDFPDLSTMNKVNLQYHEIINKDQYNENEGDSFVYTIGQHKNTRGATDIDGNIYSEGVEAWVARWNYKNELSWAYSTYDIDKKYKILAGDIVQIKSYNTTNYNTTLYFYDADTDRLLGEYLLTPNNLPSVNVNVENVKHLKVMVKDNIAVSGGTSFGLLLSLYGDGNIEAENKDELVSIDEMWHELISSGSYKNYINFSDIFHDETNIEYAIFDLDQDGLSELLITSAESSYSYFFDTWIFSWENGNVILSVEEYGYSMFRYDYNLNMVVPSSSFKPFKDASSVGFAKFINKELVYQFSVGQDLGVPYYHDSTGSKEISSEQLSDYYNNIEEFDWQPIDK